MFQIRRFSCLLLGAWLAGSVFMDLVATQNFRSVERFLSDTGVGAAQDVHTLGKAETRVLLRHFAGEQNRSYFEAWEWSQLGLGLCLLLILVFGARPPKLAILCALSMWVLILLQRTVLTPQISNIGRLLDFLPSDPGNPQRKLFWTLHGIYSGVELLKIALGVAVAGLLIIRPKPDPQMFVREMELDAGPGIRKGR